MSDETLKMLEDQLKLMAKRRDELKEKQAKTEAEYQALLDRMGSALLEDDGSKVIEGFKRDVSSTEAVRSAIAAALLQTEQKITRISMDVVSWRTKFVEAEIITLAEGMQSDAKRVISMLYDVDSQIQSLMKRYHQAKGKSSGLDITIGNLLAPDVFEAFESSKWMLALGLSHRLNVLGRHYPLAADIASRE